MGDGQQDKRAVPLSYPCLISVMPDDYSIKEFLVIHRAEVLGMLAGDYSEEEIREA